MSNHIAKHKHKAHTRRPCALVLFTTVRLSFVCVLLSQGTGITAAYAQNEKHPSSPNLPLPSTTGAIGQDHNTPEKPHGYFVLLRLFKKTQELELWVKQNENYQRQKTFSLCNKATEIGPKQLPTDNRLPEGLYPVPTALLRFSLHTKPRALPLGYPNTYELGRGFKGAPAFLTDKCDTLDHYALKPPDLDIVLSHVRKAIKNASENTQPLSIHAYPFRMSWRNLLQQKTNEYYLFWLNLKEANSFFEKEHQLPKISVCSRRYHIGLSSEPKIRDSRKNRDRDCIALMPGSEVPFELAQQHAWLKRALLQQNLAIWKTKRSISKIKVRCNLKRPSCRRWYSLRKKMIQEGKVPRELTPDP